MSMQRSWIEVRADSSPPDGVTDRSEYRARVEFSPGSYTTSEAVFLVNERIVAEASASSFFALATRLVGEPAYRWISVGATVGVTLHEPMPTSTIEQNAVKALFMITSWLEPALIEGTGADLGEKLRDEIIVDYSGTPGSQRYIYFPGASVQAAGAAVLQRLHELHLLCRAKVQIGTAMIERVFVPLVTPGVLNARFDAGLIGRESAARLWSMVRSELGTRVAKIVDRPGVR